jgi:hypothetical protein
LIDGEGGLREEGVRVTGREVGAERREGSAVVARRGQVGGLDTRGPHQRFPRNESGMRITAPVAAPTRRDWAMQKEGIVLSPIEATSFHHEIRHIINGMREAADFGSAAIRI